MNTEDAARRMVVRAVAIGVASSLAVLAFDRVWAEEPGQAWWVRWLRLAAEHPVRMGLAGAGLYLACSRTWCPDTPPGELETTGDK